jgi:hypothetical protein
MRGLKLRAHRQGGKGAGCGPEDRVRQGEGGRGCDVEDRARQGEVGQVSLM